MHSVDAAARRRDERHARWRLDRREADERREVRALLASPRGCGLERRAPGAVRAVRRPIWPSRARRGCSHEAKPNGLALAVSVTARDRAARISSPRRRSSTTVVPYESIRGAAGARHHAHVQHRRGVQLSRRRRAAGSAGSSRRSRSASARRSSSGCAGCKARSQWLLACALSLVLGGALGNADRPHPARARGRLHPRRTGTTPTSRRSTSRTPASPSARCCCCSMRCWKAAARSRLMQSPAR